MPSSFVSMRLFPFFIVGITATLSTLAFSTNLSAADEPEITFERDIRPIFRAHCFDCHGASAESTEAGLDLRLKRFLLAGGDSGPAIELDDPDSSYLLMRMVDGEMPPGDGHVPAEEIELIRKWIETGAKTARPEPEQIPEGVGIAPEDREHWSFQPIQRPLVPKAIELERADQIHTDIDALLLAKMAPKGLAFSDEASKEVLIRRVSLDLVGLQPTPVELRLYLEDESPDAYEKMVDRYLASPHYGERWGRHWLDVAGYADSEGMTQQDRIRKFAYKYRDYIISSFNSNKPFDQLIVEQLAGDELVPLPHTNLNEKQQDLLAATGFLRMAADGTDIGAFNKEVHRNAVMADTIKIMSTSLLGMTVGCAQCHDHRYDPVSQKDYYRIRAIFEPALNREHWRRPQNRLVSLYTAEERKLANEIEAKAKVLADDRIQRRTEFINAAIEKEILNQPKNLQAAIRTAIFKPAKERTKEEKTLLEKHPSVKVNSGNLNQYDGEAIKKLKEMEEAVVAMRATKPPQIFLRVLNEVPGQVPVTKVFHRGEPAQPKGAVEPAGLPIAVTDGGVMPIASNDPNLKTTGRRLAYAKWLTSGSHPLVARVMVNRFWMHHFGRPLVMTPGDFGNLGVKPEHPAVLDWLADEFMRSGWDLKQLHRTIMTSRVYRQASVNREAGLDKDPENYHYWKKPLYRLDAEAIRDSMLLASGQFNRRMYGAPVPVKENDVGQIVLGIDKKEGANRPGKHIPLHGEEFRRSVYVQIVRSKPHTMLRTFDAPQVVVNCEKRTVSTVAPQALLMMNSDFSLETSTALATRLQSTYPNDTKKQLAQAWAQAMTAPMDQEIEQAASEFINSQVAWLKEHPPTQKDAKHKYEGPEKQALIDFCQALFSSNGFMYVD